MIERGFNRDSGVMMVKTTLKDALGGMTLEPEGLNLGSAPLIVAARRTPSATEYLAVLNNPLFQNGMYDFLKQVANNKFNPGIYDVYSDWKLPDNAEREVASGRKGGYASNLQNMHVHMGRSWTTFEQHRRAFMDAVDPSFGTGYAPETLKAAVYTTDQVPHILRGLYERQAGFSYSLFYEATSKLPKDVFIRLLKERNQSKKPIRPERMSLMQLQKRLLDAIRFSANYKKSFYGGQSGTEVLELLTSTHFDRFELDVAEGVEIPVYKQKSGVKNEQPVLAKRITKTFRANYTDTVEVEYGLTISSGRVIYKRIDDKQAPYLVPAIYWISDGKSRDLMTPVDDHREVLVDIIDQFPDMNNARFSTDTLLGLLLVAYASPGIRGKWPEKVGLPGSLRDQEMGPGQMPVFAHIRKQELEKNSFLLPALEGIVNSVG